MQSRIEDLTFQISFNSQMLRFEAMKDKDKNEMQHICILIEEKCKALVKLLNGKALGFKNE